MNSIITLRLWKLFVMLVVGFSLVWLIPNSGKFKISKLTTVLPDTLAGRKAQALKISEEERKVLATDTTFARKRYHDTSNLPDTYIDVSVVFSGKDINNSIHRPEVCLKAQGWNFVSENYVEVEIAGELVPFKEIVCSRPRVKNDKIPHLDSEGNVIIDSRVQYYTFVGAEKIVAGHYERTWEDIKMRVLRGTDQQWAYITISMDIVTPETYGSAQYYNLLNLKDTKKSLLDFKTKSLPVLLGPSHEE